MRNKILTVFGCIFLAFGGFFLAVSSVLWIAAFSSDSQQDTFGNEYYVLSVKDTERFGTVYKDSMAENGYSYYEVTFEVSNQGDVNGYASMPSIHFQGEEYDDVFEYWEETEETEPAEDELFAGYYETCLPPGQSCTGTAVLEIRDGVTEFEALYYPNYDVGETSLTIHLE